MSRARSVTVAFLLQATAAIASAPAPLVGVSSCATTCRPQNGRRSHPVPDGPAPCGILENGRSSG